MQVTQRGFVSLLTAIMISLLLLAITVSLVGLQTLSLRKAEDSEQSQRAYFAAESGVEDAIAKIRSGVVGVGSDQNCLPSNPNNTKLDLGPAGEKVGWSCQSIKFSGSASDTIGQPDIAHTIDAFSRIPGGFSTVTLSWDQTNRGVLPSYYNGPSLSPAPATWGDHVMPLELTIVQAPSTTFSISQLRSTSLVLRPSNSTGATTIYNPAIPPTAAISAGHCTSSGYSVITPTQNYGKYHCQIKISGFSVGANYLFRLQSLYVGDDGFGSGNFVMTFDDGHVLINDSTATIDVTGEANNIFRRVIYRVPVNRVTNAAFNQALFSEVGICQDYTIINGTTKSPPGECP